MYTFITVVIKEVPIGKSSFGRSRLRWKDRVKKDVRQCNQIYNGENLQRMGKDGDRSV